MIVEGLVLLIRVVVRVERGSGTPHLRRVVGVVVVFGLVLGDAQDVWLVGRLEHHAIDTRIDLAEEVAFPLPIRA